MAGTLNKIGLKYGTDKATYHKFLDFYEQHLPVRSEAISLLEIGVRDGASVKMWREYYPYARIFAVDINPPLRINGCDIYQLDATNLYNLHEMENMSMYDVIIDDGSHMTEDQQVAFNFFHEFMRSGDIYIIEDIHTSDWPQYRNTIKSTEEFVRDLVPGWQIFIHHTIENPNDSKTMLIIKP